jgi:hypothetical protein
MGIVVHKIRKSETLEETLEIPHLPTTPEEIEIEEKDKGKGPLTSEDDMDKDLKEREKQLRNYGK